ncbi:hypothetical protein BD626DRAFT_567951 [Schizophyllum amplum]|uniref:Xylanolytic transcriptional activator regulatory domain-containing protein n=1 Tax=Schizophyllum amplum TaxID=97359 RepID=A0A550CJX5_9AGAR|nr:hypothetical protein BD626DRAFT_567951 [Auriculariopsis ampla]
MNPFSFSSERNSRESDHIPRQSPATPEVKPTAAQNLLPSTEELDDACRSFITSYFQLGFIPKAMFLERLSEEPDSVPVFLLLAILSVSARFTPSLVRRYGNASKATEVFLQRAESMVPQEMYKPTLERIQAFFILSTAEWGQADSDKSFMHLGIAVRMAGYLRLHREETYRVPPDASVDAIVKSEVARRTFWMVENQANLQAGINHPPAFARPEITALLPCDESDFAFGTLPAARAALAGTAPERTHPHLASIPARSLFATLIQTHNLWGQVARRAVQWENGLPASSGKVGAPLPPWNAESDFARLCEALGRFERELPPRHQWSVQNLRGYRAEAMDLSYLSIVLVLRMSNVVVRRVYLPYIAVAVGIVEEQELPSEEWNLAPPAYWRTMARDLFADVRSLYEQLDAAIPLCPQGFPPIIVFCIYICGSLASYVCKWPQLCLDLAFDAHTIFRRALEMLNSAKDLWPKARAWQNALAQSSTVLGGPDSATGEQAQPAAHYTQPPPPQPPSMVTRSNMLYELATVAINEGASAPQPANVGNGTLVNGLGEGLQGGAMQGGAMQGGSLNALGAVGAYLPGHPIATVYDSLIQTQAPGLNDFFANSFEAELTAFLHGGGGMGSVGMGNGEGMGWFSGM